MTSLKDLLEKLYKPFLELDCDVTHFRRLSKFPYVVWAEDGEENSFSADNIKQEQRITGMVDLFTRTEFDSLIDDIQEILNEEQIGWVLSSVQYEEETNLIHYQWRWWVI